MLRTTLIGAAVAVLAACIHVDDAVSEAERDLPFAVESVVTLDEPWAMTFMPAEGRRLALVTEKRGTLQLVDLTAGQARRIDGVPEVAYGGQGGFGDVVLHPDFANNSFIYLSYAEAGDGDTRGAAVARARLVLEGSGGGRLANVEVIWRQVPKVSGKGHYGHRIAFDRDGYLFISSGERQKFDPAQDMTTNLGKIVRLHDDGTAPDDNPFANQGGVAAQIWSLGHRNPLGLAFDADGQLWVAEMGPRGGDELNQVVRGANYGYPIVSNGDHYDGRPIPDHDTRPEFAAPAVWWTPVISPSSLVFYAGTEFPDWQGDALIGGLSSRSLVRVAFDGNTASEVERYPMGKRIREVEVGPDAAVYLLEDGSGGRLLRLTPGDRSISRSEK